MIDVWTFDYDPDHDLVAPIKTSCEVFGYPRRDVRGETMFENTHFRTEDEAWQNLRDNSDAMENNAAVTYRHAKAELRKATDQLAKTADYAVRVRRAHEARQYEIRNEQFKEKT